MTNEIDKIRNEYQKLKDAEYLAGMELYKLKNGSLITKIEYKRKYEELDLRYKREVRKREKGVKYVDKDTKRRIPCELR